MKTHTITGLKYLGKTTSKDPHKYSGSGKYWKRHLKKHGNLYTTEILKECQHPALVKFWGQYYSDLWNVVESDEWANLVPEEGQGMSGETQRIIQNRPEVKEKNIAGVKKFYQNNPHVKEDHRKRALEHNPMHDLEIRIKHKEIVSKTNTGEKNSSCDKRLHCFYNNESGIEEYCTQNYLKKKYNLKKCGISQLVSGNKLNAYGWCIKVSH